LPFLNTNCWSTELC